MQEVLPGVWHWTAHHPRLGIVVSSYWLEDGGVLIDPLVPEQEGLEWFASRSHEPAAVMLTNRHHLRESERFAERFACPIHCNSAGLLEFAGGLEVAGFEPGEELPGGVIACQVGAICPDETALHLPAQRALALADGIVRGGASGAGGPLGFVPDSLMDDPPATKRGLLAACARLLERLDFEHLLLAHGGPVVGDGRALLEDLLECGGRTAFEM
jgi:hypothetical protein